MKLNIHTLKQESFEIDVNNDATVLNIREKVSELKVNGYDNVRLIFNGQVLLDDKKTLNDIRITEGATIVILPEKKKKKKKKITTPSIVPTESATISEPSDSKSNDANDNNTDTTVTSTTEGVSTAPTSSITSPVESSSSATTTTTPTPTTTTISNTDMVLGPEVEAMVNNLMEMGFERNQCITALRAAFNNPNRAVEYLMNGIPSHLLNASSNNNPNNNDNNPSNTSTDEGSTNNTPANPNAIPSSGLNLSPSELNMALQELQNNPEMLQRVLQQITQSNPELAQALSENPQAFMQFLQQGMSQGMSSADNNGNTPQRHVIQLTQEEKSHIDQLESFGFTRNQALEAYLVNGRDFNNAANFLFENQSNYDDVSMTDNNPNNATDNNN